MPSWSDLVDAITGNQPKGPVPLSSLAALWPADNPVGTEQLGQQSMRVPRGEFDPVVDTWPTGKPRTQSERQGIEDTSMNLFDQLSMISPTGAQGRVAARVTKGGTVRPPGSTPRPPEPAGRLGGNADTQLAALGLPTYADIVPSPNRGPISQERLRAGAPQGQVFDLSDTWRVPDVPQTDLSRIDPNAGRRKGLPPHIQRVIDNPELAQKMRFVAETGTDVGGAYWYNAEPFRKAFVDELGEAQGNELFRRYASIIGATSAGSDVGQNVRAASYYLTQERAGTPVRTSADLISPYGHKMQQAHISGYRGLDEGGTLDPQTQPKRASFVENLSGNQQPLTMDKHNYRLIGMLSQDPAFLNTKTTADVNYPKLGIKKGESRNWRDEVTSGRISMEQALEHPHMWQDIPDPNHYAALERWQQGIGGEMGLSPAQFQAGLWVGGGRVTGLRSLPTSFMGTVENRLLKTARERGGTPDEALRDFIRGKAPLLTPLGAALAAQQSSDRSEE